MRIGELAVPLSRAMPGCRIGCGFILLLVATLTAPRVHAQYTGNYQTNTIDGVVSTWPGDYHVGDHYDGDVLQILNGGVLSNGNAVIGNDAGADNNAAIVSGSVWSNRWSLTVGNRGAGNQLVVTNGGAVYDTGCEVGGLSRDNTAVVVGLGSVWGNSSSLRIGSYGRGNTLTIADGGAVYNTDGVVGYGGAGSNNWVLVTGTGSTWSNTLRLVVGYYGDSNLLTVAGGSVLASNMVIGYSASASNNVVRVNSGSLVVANAAGDGALVVGRSGGKAELILNDGTITVDHLIATNGANSVITYNGGTLTTSGTILSNNAPLIVGAVGLGTMNLLPGQHTFGDGLVVGYNGGVGIGSVVLSGGTVNAQSLYVTNGMYSFFTFDSGTLVSGTTRVDNGLPFVVGNGTAAATLGLDGGQHAFVNGLTMAANSTLQGTGTVVGPITSAGVLSPGFSAGQLDVQGDVTQQVGSVLSLEIGGTQQGIDYDFLNITGSGYLTGQVQIALLDSFVPSSANVFTTVYASVDLLGSFDNLVGGRLTTLGNEGSFLVSFGSGGSGFLFFDDFLSLQVIPEPSILVLVLGGAVLVRFAQRRIRP